MSPESLPSPPRPIRRRREAGGAWLLWFVVVGGMIASLLPAMFLTARQLVLRYGVVTEATVDQPYVATGKNTAGFHVAFHYSLGTRVEHGDQQVDRAEWVELGTRKSTPVRVKVFFGLPYALLPVPSAGANLIAHLVVAIASPIGAGFIAWLVYGQDFRDRRLVRSGRAVPGIIINRRVTGSRSTGRHVSFEFVLPGGIPTTGEMQTDAWAYARCAVGDDVTVLYDSDHPDRSTIYELCTYESTAVAA
jgi:hypothetical protein